MFIYNAAFNYFEPDEAIVLISGNLSLNKSMNSFGNEFLFDLFISKISVSVQ